MNLEDPTQLCHSLDSLAPTERAGCIVALVLRALLSPDFKMFLMTLEGPLVSDVMEQTRLVGSPIDAQTMVDDASRRVSCLNA